MSPLTKDAIRFGTFVVTAQVFHITPLSFALVNLKPLLPGHVLVSPRRIVPRFTELSTAEVQDLFLTVQCVSRTIERLYGATALNIAIQDGRDAGQSVPHVHAHIIPRRNADLPEPDQIYGMMENEGSDMDKQFKIRDAQQDGSAEGAMDGMFKDRDSHINGQNQDSHLNGQNQDSHGNGQDKRVRFPAVDADKDRKPRSDDVMEREAKWLAQEMVKDAQQAR